MNSSLNSPPAPNRYLEEKTKAQKDLEEWRRYLRAGLAKRGPARGKTGTPGAPGLSREELWKLQDGRCWICGLALDRSFISRDHLHPVSKGGYGKPNNILLAHTTCNTKRGNKGIYTREEALAMLARRVEGE